MASFPGRLRPVLLSAPQPRDVSVAAGNHRRDGRRRELRVHAGVRGARVADFKAGQTVVVQGAGGLGVYACAVAREMGASRVIVIDGIDERLELARDFGADTFVDLREFTTPDARVKRVGELTDNWGGDVVLELVGHPGVVDDGVRMTAPG